MAWSDLTVANATAGNAILATDHEKVFENLNILGGAWTSFTPTWTNVTLTSATNQGHYMAAGKLYIVRVKLTWGASTAFTASPLLTLPNSASLNSAYGTSFPLGVVQMWDNSASAIYTGSVLAPTSGATQVRFASHNAAGTYLQLGSWDATNPVTWATSDRLEAQFIFEAA